MPKIVDKDAMRERILDAAERAFHRDGITQVRMVDIATELSVAKGTIYLYFPSRAELISALVTRFFKSAKNPLAAAPPAPSLEAFQTMILQMVTASSPDESTLLRFFSIFGAELKNPDINTPLAAYFDMLADALGAELSRLSPNMPDHTQIARTLVSVIDGLMLHRGLFGHNADIDTTKRLIAAILSSP